MFRYDLLKQKKSGLPPDPHRWQTGAIPALQEEQISSQKLVGRFLASDGLDFAPTVGSAPFFELPALRLPFDDIAR